MFVLADYTEMSLALNEKQDKQDGEIGDQGLWVNTFLWTLISYPFREYKKTESRMELLLIS